MSNAPSLNCPICGFPMENITSIADDRWQYVCASLDCKGPHHRIAGELIDDTARTDGERAIELGRYSADARSND